MAQRAGEKSWEAAISRRRWWNLSLKSGFDIKPFLERFNVQPGIFMTALSIGALVATAASLSVPMAGAWWCSSGPAIPEMFEHMTNCCGQVTGVAA
jgi:hypothetical protein